MLRARRRDVNLKPNRRLDRKSSRGMLYENEELRLRTININAEVERGQNDIKKLRRENEQLRREIWGLREEYDRLEQLLGSLHPRAEDESEEECEDGENAKNLQRANDGLSVVEEEPLHPQEPTCLSFPVGGNLEQLLREVRGDDQSDTNSHTDCERPEESSPTPLVTTLPAGDSDSDWERKETTDRFRSQISIQLKPPDENPFSGSFQEALDGRSVLFSSSLQDLGPSSNADARHSDRKRWLPPLKMSLSSSSQDPGSPAPDPNPTRTPTPAPALPSRMSSAISPESPSNRRVSVNFSKKNSTAARSGSVYSRSFSVDGERLDSVARADSVAAPDRSVPWCACWGNGCI